MSSHELEEALLELQEVDADLRALEAALDSVAENAQAITDHREHLARVSDDVASLARSLNALNQRALPAYTALTEALERSQSVLEKVERASKDLDANTIVARLDTSLVAITDRLAGEFSSKMGDVSDRLGSVLEVAEGLRSASRDIEEALRVLNSERLATTLDDAITPLTEAVEHLKRATERSNRLSTLVETGQLVQASEGSSVPSWLPWALLILLIAQILISAAALAL